MEMNLSVIRQYGEEVAVELEGENNSSQGTVIIETYSKAKRFTRFILSVLICLTLIVVSAVIPILHFVLIPLSIIISPFIIIMLSSSKDSIKGGKGTCPFCKADFSIYSRSNKFPFYDICSACGRQVRISRAS